MRIPGCGAVLRSSFEWFVQVPVEKVMLARRDQWRRPHRDAFNVLEKRVQILAKDASDAQQAAIEAGETSKTALTEVQESSQRAAEAEKANRQLEVVVKSTQRSAAQRMEEATVAKVYSAKQAANMIDVRTEHEKTLRDLNKEQRLRSSSDEKRVKLEAKVETLEAEVNDYVKKLKGTRAAKRAQKIQMRHKVVVGAMQEYHVKHRTQSIIVSKEVVRMTEGIGMMGKLDHAMAGAVQQDRKAENEQNSGGATVKTEASTLVKYTQVSGEFATQALEAAVDHDTCIGNLDKLLDAFSMANDLPDSDSDGEAAEIETLKKDNDLLREKLFFKDQAISVKDEELKLRQETITRLSDGLRLYDDWQKKIENEVQTIKQDASRKMRVLEEEMQKMQSTMQEMKMREQGFKDEIRKLQKDIAAKDKEISQFESKLAQIKNKIESLEKENEVKTQKISKLELQISDLKEEIQSLKEENKALQNEIKLLNSKIDQLDAELQVERETVARLSCARARARAHTHTHTYAHVHTHTYARTTRMRNGYQIDHARAQTQAQTQSQAQTQAQTQTQTQIHTRTCAHIQLERETVTRLPMRACTHTHRRTQTHTRIRTCNSNVKRLPS